MENGNILKAIVELKADMIAMEERLRQHMHDTEIRIVGEFNRAQSMNARMRQTEVTITPIMDRMTEIEARLLDMERRLFFPGAQ